MKRMRLISFIIALPIFALGWSTHTAVFAEQKQTPKERRAACTQQNTQCRNDCRNGTLLPLGSPANSIETCDIKCRDSFDSCMNAPMALRGGQTMGTFQNPSAGGLMQSPAVNPSAGSATSKQPAVSGKNAPIMRRGVEGEQPESSITAPKEKGK
jgi:hypothetical protein